LFSLLALIVTKWSKLFAKSEALLGLAATFMVGFATPLVSLLAAFVAIADYLPEWLQWLGILALPLAAVLTIPVARLAYFAMDECFPQDKRPPVQLPLAIVMAAHLPRIPLLLRPLLSAWWLAHFAMGGLMGFGLCVGTEKLLAAHHLAAALPLIVYLGMLFAVNLYLLLAIAVLFHRPRLWMKLWRNRLLADVIVAVIVVLFIKN
jgi:hypothetical protein